MSLGERMSATKILKDVVFAWAIILSYIGYVCIMGLIEAGKKVVE